MQKLRPTLWPRPRQWCLGLLPHVLQVCEFLGVGLVQLPVKLNEAECDLYYILLLPMNESWLHIISWPVITYYYCYYTVITLLLCIIASFIIMYHYNFFLTLLLHHYYILLHHSSLLSITFSVITLLLHHYYILLQLLHIITYSLLPIVTKSLSQVITSLLHHYYIIITSLFPIAKTGNNELIITFYALSLFSLLQCYYPLLSIITHYYLLPTGQLADAVHINTYQYIPFFALSRKRLHWKPST